MIYFAVPATPAEQQDSTINPSGQNLGWIVVNEREDVIDASRFMTREEAIAIADRMNGV